MKGKLYGVGIGPGDPELITIKAKRILESADYIAIPKTASDKPSQAMAIVSKILDVTKPVLELIFPMSFNDKVLEDSWLTAVTQLKDKLNEGKSVAFITLGDPTVYSTYIYIHKILCKEGYEAEIIPGITSFCASAARAGISLGENKENIAIVPSAYEGDKLDDILDNFENVVLMKVAKNLDKVKKSLVSKGLQDKAVLISKCGFEDEMIEYEIDKVDSSELSYFTTMIIKRNGAL